MTRGKSSSARQGVAGKKTAARKAPRKKSANTTQKASKRAAPDATVKAEPTTAANSVLTVVPFELPNDPRSGREAILSVSFDEAIATGPLLGEVARGMQASLAGEIAAHGGDALATALAGATIVMERGTVIARFSKEGARLLKAKELRLMGAASGNPVATLINSSGRTVEKARVMGPLTKGTRVAANLTVAAVTVAHIVSGADLAKKLQKLDSKVDFLVAAHRIDQLAKVEGVFRQARELVHLGLNEQRQAELHRLGRELFEVRSAWRREIAHHLGNLHRSEESANWLVGFFQGRTRKGKDAKVGEVVQARDSEIQLISGSIAIHLALAHAAGTLDSFLQVSLPDELAELKRVRLVLLERRDFIHDKHPELRQQVTEVCARLDNLSDIYSKMVLPFAISQLSQSGNS